MVKIAGELQARASVWIINPQDAVSTAQFKARRNAPFVFLVDENLAVIGLYGIFHTLHTEHGYIPYPVTFIVRSDGTIAWRFLGLKARDRPTNENLLQALAAMQ